MRFDLVDLRLFLHVVEAASITHGAARAHLALASASERIRGMEAALGVPLLDRGRRGVRPTPAGQALVHHARLVQQQLERLAGEMGDYARGLKGHVRLLSNTAALTEYLPELLASFLAAHPSLDIDLEEKPSHAIAAALRDGLADLGILADSVPLDGLTGFPFRRDRLVLVAPRTHPAAGRRSIGLADLLDQSFVGLVAGSALQEHVDRHARRLGGPLKLRVRVGSFEAVCRMVEQGVGLAIIPETAARRCRRTMALRLVRLADPWALRQLTLCVSDVGALPPQARRLLEHLLQPSPGLASPEQASREPASGAPASRAASRTAAARP